MITDSVNEDATVTKTDGQNDVLNDDTMHQMTQVI